MTEIPTAVALVAAKKKHSGENRNNLFSVFDSTDGALYVSSLPWQPARSLVSLATLCFELGDSLPCSVSLLFAVRIGMLLRSSEELDDVREADDAGGRTVDEWLHQILLRSPQKMPNSRRQLCRALDTLACFGRWRTLTIYLGISLYDGRLDVVLICHRVGQIGNRSAVDLRLPLLADSAPLSAFSTPCRT